MEIFYKMLFHKLRVIHIENDTMDYLLIVQNINEYHRVHNNCGGNSGTVLPCERIMKGTRLPKNAGFRSKNIPTRNYSALPSLHIGCTE